MRAGIGLLSLLLAVAIILMVMFSGPHGGYVPTVINTGQTARQQANQISGRDENGMPVKDSIVLEEDSSGGQLRGMVVKSVVSTGPMATAYGLKAGDEIVQVWGLRVRDQNDPGMVKAQIYESYGRNQPLVIQRDGQELTLTPNSPLTKAFPGQFGAPGATSNGPATPNLPERSNPVQNIPTH
jgi:membrane-associated protease RseP (regulator of RpoE activity)